MALSTIQQTLMGLLTPGAQAASGSIYDQARADAQRQMLAQLGMGLVGAAVPQTPLMRAQALQQAFSGVGNIGTGVYNAAQARLMAQKAEGEQRRAAALNEFFSQNPSAQTDAVSSVDIGGGFRGPQSTFGSEASVVPGSKISQIPAAERLAAPPPPTARIPGGLSQEQWSGIQQLSQIDPEKAIEVYGSLVKKGAGAETGGFEGSKSLIGVFDENNKFFQTYVNTDGTIVQPKGATGNLRFATPEEINAQKASGTATGKAEGEARSGAPAAITAADKTINLIDKILADPSLPNVVGDLEGRFEDPTLVRRWAGESGVATINRINQLKAKGFIQAINTTDIKGALSDAEGSKLDSAENALSRVMSEDSFREELMAYRDIAIRAKQRQALIESGKTEAEARQLIPESPFVGTETPTASESIPDGIDPEVWKFMTPEQRNLWK